MFINCKFYFVDFLEKGRVFKLESLFRVSTLLYTSSLDFKSSLSFQLADLWSLFIILQLGSWRKIHSFLLWALFFIQLFQITIEQFSMFFLNKIDCLDHMLHGSNITNLNHYTASLFQIWKQLLHCACISVK